MGLDISLYKVLPRHMVVIDENTHFVSPTGRLRKFFKPLYLYKKEITYSDIQGELERLGKTKVIWNGTSYDKKGVEYKYLDTENPLFKYVKKFRQDKKLTKKETEELKTLFPDVDFDFIQWELSKKCTIVLRNPPTFKKKEWKIIVEEIGYQRKGANQLFYDDKMWNVGKPVLSLKELKKHYQKYFKGEKSSFKRNILDNFIEGEMFVLYH